MKITVALELNDSEELGGLAKFVEQVEGYRATNARLAVAQESMARDAALQERQPAPGAGIGGGEVLTPPAPEPQVVATIVPGAPKAADLNKAALEYGKKHGLDKALELVRAQGVAKVSDLKDPAKMLALYTQFQEGL
jgi:hypothetical protein